MHLTSDIECGNGKIIQTGPSSYHVETVGHRWRPKSYNQYFCFAIKAAPSEEILVNIAVYPDSELGFKSHFMTHFPSNIWFSHKGYSWKSLETIIGAEIKFFKDHLEFSLPVASGMEIIISNCIPLPYSEYAEWLKKLASENNNKIKLETIGESFEGRPLAVARFQPARPGLPKVFIVAGQHPSEFSGVWASMGIIEYLLSSIREAREFIENLDIAVLPMLNPDGNAHGHSGHSAEKLDINLFCDFEEIPQGKLPRTKENRVMWQWLNEKFVPDYLLHFHGYKGGSAGTMPHDGLYCLKDPASVYTDKKNIERHRAIYQRLLFETPGFSAHWRLFGVLGEGTVEYQLAKKHGTLSMLYEVNGSTVGCNEQFQRGPQVLGAFARAIVRDIPLAG